MLSPSHCERSEAIQPCADWIASSLPFLAMTAQKTAIVTGAGKRVGAEIARSLLEDGWAVIAHVHHADDDVPDGAAKVVADLGELDCAETIFAAATGLPPL